MGWRKWRSSPSLTHQADLEQRALGKQVDPRASRIGVGGPYGTLRKGECSCILCSFAPNPTLSSCSHSLKKSTMGTFPRSIRFPRIPPSLLRSSPSLLSPGSSSTSFFSSPRSSASTLSSFPSSPCLRYMKKRGKSRARLDNSSERGGSGGREKRGDGGRGVSVGRMGLGEVQGEEAGRCPRRWHSVQSLLRCHRRWDNNYIQSTLSLPCCIFVLLYFLCNLNVCIFFCHKRWHNRFVKYLISFIKPIQFKTIHLWMSKL